MLERDRNKSYMEKEFEEGYQCGRQESMLKLLIGIIHVTGTEPIDIQHIIGIQSMNVQKEQIEEIQGYMKRYPYMNRNKLAKRIMKESEYLFIWSDG